MARTMIRDGGGGRRRTYARLTTSAFCLLLISTLMVGCNLNSPTSPNEPGNLTGQTTNQSFNFSGTIVISRSSAWTVADGTSTVTFTATVRDASGNPINNLTQVFFSTNLGGFIVGTDNSGLPITSSTASGVTFNGQASVSFVSGASGTATISASIGTTSASTKVDIKPAALEGTISLVFGATPGSGTVTLAGVASSAVPLEAAITLQALDPDGAPIVGANVDFRILEDTTSDTTSNADAEFAVSRHTTTGPDGDAVNIIRAFGPGYVVIVAELYDSNTGNLVGTSNRIILTVANQVLVTQAFDAGGATTTVAIGVPAGITATVVDIDGVAQPGLTVRFTIVEDSSDGGSSLSAAVAVTDAAGQAKTSLTIPDDAAGAGASASVLVEVIDSSGTVVATGNIVIGST